MPDKTTAFFIRNCHDYGVRDAALCQREYPSSAPTFLLQKQDYSHAPCVHSKTPAASAAQALP